MMSYLPFELWSDGAITFALIFQKFRLRLSYTCAHKSGAFALSFGVTFARILSGVFPFRLLPFCLLPFRLLPFRLLQFRLLSIVKSVPFRLHSRFCTLPSFKGILIRPVHICTILIGQKKAFAFDGKLLLQI